MGTWQVRQLPQAKGRVSQPVSTEAIEEVREVSRTPFTDDVLSHPQKSSRSRASTATP